MTETIRGLKAFAGTGVMVLAAYYLGFPFSGPESIICYFAVMATMKEGTA